jgi:hypothetical protein
MTLNPFPESVPQSPTSSSSGTAIAPAASTPSQSPQNGFTRTVYDGMLDIEEDLSKPVPAGYPALVKLIVKYPEFEAFQSFKDLNIKSLLYYQAELDELRRDLHRLEWRDYRGEPFHGAEECCLTVDRLLWGRDSGDKNAGRQYKKMEKIREVLKEYNAALLQYSKISALPKADSFNVNSLHTWLCDRPKSERIRGLGSESWGKLDEVDAESEPEFKSFWSRTWQLFHSPFWTTKKNENRPKLDLIVPRAPGNADGLALWVAHEFVPWWQCLKDCLKNRIQNRNQDSMDEEKAKWPKSKDPEPKTAEAEADTVNKYRGKKIVQFTSFISTIVACLLPTVAIAVLDQLHTTATLLGLIAVFTAVFAGGLMLLVESGTSRVEIFTATAAFSAVMVVFVQNQNPPNTLGGTSLASNRTIA